MTKTQDATRRSPTMDSAHVLYVWLAGLSVASLLIADVIGIKLFRIPIWLPWRTEPLVVVQHSCGMLTFPITFLLTDLLNEYYGKKAARRVTFISLVMALFAFGVINLAQAMPYLNEPYNISRQHFDAVFGAAKIMYIASVTAYLVGQLADIWVFHLLKKFTRGRLLWLRATGSTVISQTLDSFVVSYLAFSLGRQWFPDPANPPAHGWTIVEIAATGYVLKFVLAILVTPLIYLGRDLVHRGFGLEPLPPEDPRA